MNTLAYKFWGWVFAQAQARIQRYQLDTLTDYDFLDKIELEQE